VHLIKKWKEGWWSGSSCKSTCLASMMCWIKALVLPKKKRVKKRKKYNSKLQRWAGGVVQVVECLPSKLEGGIVFNPQYCKTQ
jgi:hypothetical protein